MGKMEGEGGGYEYNPGAGGIFCPPKFGMFKTGRGPTSIVGAIIPWFRLIGTPFGMEKGGC